MKFNLAVQHWQRNMKECQEIKSVNYLRSKDFFKIPCLGRLFFNVKYCHFSILFICKIIIWGMMISMSEGWEKGKEKGLWSGKDKGRKRVNIY